MTYLSVENRYLLSVLNFCFANFALLQMKDRNFNQEKLRKIAESTSSRQRYHNYNYPKRGYRFKTRCFLLFLTTMNNSSSSSRNQSCILMFRCYLFVQQFPSHQDFDVQHDYLVSAGGPQTRIRKRGQGGEFRLHDCP